MANDTRRLERELRDAQARLQEDLDATRRLLRVGTLFLHESNLESVLGEIVETAIAITGADFGNMQLRDRESGDLKIVAHRGFPQWWLDFWNRMHVGHGACGVALQQSSRVVVHDVERDPIFEGAALEMQKRAGVRAVQSTPLVSRSGAPIGIISTHFREPHVPSAHALALMDLLARQATVSIDVQVATTPVRIDGDATRLEQVFGNLIDNAVKYTPRGGRIAVSVDTDAASGTGRLRVRDTGRGVSPELVPHLFEPFVQADKSLDRKEGGLGLGLAVAKMIVVLHGGTIAVASPGPGMGTTFTVTLPLEGAPAALDAQSTNESIARPKRVLVIDDNVDTSDMLRMLLELEGYDVDVAADGAAGIEHARVFSPDVILCDIGLPVMNGYEVARTLRTDKQLGNVKLVAVTGYGSREDVERAKDAGFDVHVTKPIDSDQLVAQVGTLTDDAPAARRRIVRGGSRRIQARARRAKI